MSQRNNLQTADTPPRANAFAADPPGHSAFVNSIEPNTRVASPAGRSRRQSRIAVSLPVMVRDQFGTQEETRTQFVMLRGAVIATTSNLRVGGKISLRSLSNARTAECHVIAAEPIVKGAHQVEVEFTGPQPDFWPVQFPADDFPKSEPAQAGSSAEIDLKRAITSSTNAITSSTNSDVNNKQQPAKSSADYRPNPIFE